MGLAVKTEKPWLYPFYHWQKYKGHDILACEYIMAFVFLPTYSVQ
jgi:hypothetical protein